MNTITLTNEEMEMVEGGVAPALYYIAGLISGVVTSMMGAYLYDTAGQAPGINAAVSRAWQSLKSFDYSAYSKPEQNPFWW